MPAVLTNPHHQIKMKKCLVLAQIYGGFYLDCKAASLPHVTLKQYILSL